MIKKIILRNVNACMVNTSFFSKAFLQLFKRTMSVIYASICMMINIKCVIQQIISRKVN